MMVQERRDTMLRGERDERLPIDAALGGQCGIRATDNVGGRVNARGGQ